MSELERARETELEYLREELAARERELDVAYKRIDQLILATRHLPAFRQIMREAYDLGKAAEAGPAKPQSIWLSDQEAALRARDVDRDFDPGWPR